MIHRFKISKSKEGLERQWQYLSKRGLNNKLRALKTFSLSVAIITILILFLLFLTSANSLIGLKGAAIILAAIAWLICLLYAISLLVNQFTHRWFLKTRLTGALQEQLNYEAEMTDDKLRIFSNTSIKEYSWTDLASYGIHDNTIYLFNKSKPLDSLFWAKEEIGDDNYLFFVELLKSKHIHQTF